MRRSVLRPFGAALAVCLGLLCFFPQGVQAAEAPPLQDAVDAYIVIDASTGQVLVEKNSHKAEFPASITKILTLGLTLEANPLDSAAMDNQVEVSYRACHELMNGASHIALQQGEVVSVRDLVYATQLRSANDAANLLAEYNDGSIEAFAGRMNQKAASLGLCDSHFTNPSGQADENHYTSAYDMAQITRWALGVPGFSELFGAAQYTMAPTNFREEASVFRANNGIALPESSYYYEGVTGSKQGYTDDARYTLVTSARRNGIELICVVMRSDTNAAKYSATSELLDYCFNNFHAETFSAADISPADVPVFGGGDSKLGDITVRGGDDVTFLLHNSLTLADVQVERAVPERYVIGQPFVPEARFSVPGAAGRQFSEIFSVPLSWVGLDGVLAANTTAAPVGWNAPWSQVARENPLAFWLAISFAMLVLTVIFVRATYVRRKRNRRRQARLAAARAQLPVSIANRPPPSRQATQAARSPDKNVRRSSVAPSARANLQVAPPRASAVYYNNSRRVGRRA